MKLLAITPPAELPADALLARLRCRRAAIRLHDKASVERLPTDPFGWVFQKLNRHLRARLCPFFELHVMRNIILGLRYRLAEETPPATLLNKTLLNEQLYKLMLAPQLPEELIRGLEEAFIKDYPFTEGLLATYRLQGPGGVEQQLADGVMQHCLNTCGDKRLKQFLRYLVDLRNCLIVLKLWRWQVRQSPRLQPGGCLPRETLKRIWASQDTGRLESLASQLAGGPVSASTSTGFEQAMLNGLSRLLNRAGRDPLSLSVIIEYLWKAQLAIHNQRLRQALAEDRAELLDEVLIV